MLRDFLNDVKLAVRQFVRRPGFTVMAVVTLGLGLGATVALFSVVRGLLLRPLPVADESGLHVFWSDWDWRGSELDFVRERQRAFSGLAGFSADCRSGMENKELGDGLLHAASPSLAQVIVNSESLFPPNCQEGSNTPLRVTH